MRVRERREQGKKETPPCPPRRRGGKERVATLFSLRGFGDARTRRAARAAPRRRPRPPGRRPWRHLPRCRRAGRRGCAPSSSPPSPRRASRASPPGRARRGPRSPCRSSAPAPRPRPPGRPPAASARLKATWCGRRAATMTPSPISKMRSLWRANAASTRTCTPSAPQVATACRVSPSTTTAKVSRRGGPSEKPSSAAHGEGHAHRRIHRALRDARGVRAQEETARRRRRPARFPPDRRRSARQDARR